MDEFKICSLNVRGFKNNLKRKTMIRYLKKQSYDIIALQETYINNDEARKFEREMGFIYHHTSGIGRSRGLVTAFSRKIESNSVKLIFKTDRILISEIHLKNKRNFIVNIYAPCADEEKINFFNQLKLVIEDKIPLEERANIICLGDFNTVRDNNLDIISGTMHSKRTIAAFNDFIEWFDFKDIWREHNPKIKDYTWCRPDMSSARRLDYILTGLNLCHPEYKMNTHFHTIALTDHRAVVLSLNTDETAKGNSIFKIDNRLLNDINYVKIIKETINDTVNNNIDLDPQLKWEMVKIKIRETSEQYYVTFRRQQQIITKKNENRLKYLENELINDPKNKNITKDICKLKKEIELKLIADTRAAATRAGVKWIEQGEKSNAYFLGLEKSRSNANKIIALNNENGEAITDQTKIMGEIKTYFENIYTEDKKDTNIINNLDKYSEDVIIPQISDNDKYLLESEITLQEVTKALKGMNAGSSPGLDGISTEFYKLFWMDIKQLVYDSLMHAKQGKKLSLSQRKGVFTLIHKGKDLDKSELKNWRPISLMNVDYKILTRVLAGRLQGVISSIIHDNQSGFVKGRQISKLIREVDDVIERDKYYKASNILLAIDFEKAFDTISCTFIRKMCSKFGIGENFGDWIDIIMKDRLACVKNNGLVSSNFELQRGIRQGCALSPLLFIMAVELLAIKIRNDENIKGAMFGRYITKIRQYADDTTFLLRDDIDVREVLSRLKEFEIFSGLKLNKTKSNILIAGNKNLIGTQICGIKVCHEIKVLGVYFSVFKRASENVKNWQNKIVKTKEAIKQWSRRDLTIVGKILVIKTFGLSNFVYLMGSIGMPNWVLKEINNCFFTFLWKNNHSDKRATERVRRQVMCNDIEEGGLSMIDLNDFQDGFILSWVEQFLTAEENEEWTNIPLENFKKVGGKAVFETLTEVKNMKGKEEMFSQFWVNALNRWQELKQNSVSENITIYEVLFNNKKITYKNNVLLLHDCVNHNIIRIHDMLRQDKSILSFNDFSIKYQDLPNKLMNYNVLYNALKRLDIEDGNQGLDDVILFRDVEIGKIGRKAFMSFIRNNDLPFIIEMWKNKFNIEIGKEHWSLTYHVTKEVRLRTLQWKLLHNVYPTNIHLKRMKIKDTEFCDWCEEIEHSEHAFFDCRKIRPIWDEIEKVFAAKTNILHTLTRNEVMFGIIKPQRKMKKSHLRLLNHMILIGKVSISKFRFTKSPSITDILYKELSMRIT